MLRPPANQLSYSYEVYGLTLASALRLNLPTGSSQKPQIELHVVDASMAETALSYPEPNDWIGHAIADNGDLHMRWGDWFEIVALANGRSVYCRNLCDAPLQTFEAYLTNFAVSAALIQKGEEPLHATVVDIGDCSIGFLGPSGAGKSTLAAFLISQGGALVTDDMLRIVFDKDKVFAHPGPYRIKLFEEPARRFLSASRGSSLWNPLGEKLIFEPDQISRRTNKRVLSALYFLDAPSADRGVDQPSVTALSGVELFNTILSSSMNTRYHLRERLERQFKFAERLARELPVFRLTYRREFESFNQVAKLIRESSKG